ncbi:MAG: DSD1 family PLP-dependent enzyme [Planctomycetales bacterium]|nr:DSD1 family PLP-dependent enzyme [Planctomycetales bacterium]
MPMNRRRFLAAGMGVGLLTHREHHVNADENVDRIDPTKLTKSNVPTPALLLDLDLFEANVKTMAEHCQRAGRGFRPHAKTHKCPEIAKQQMKAGALGISVATVPEAEAMVAAGITGVLLTSPIVEPAKIARMVALIQHGGQVMLSVGHPRQIELLAEAAGAAEVNVDVLVDVDIGDRRTGILPGQPAVELAQLIAKQKRLRIRGVQSYAGLASHVVGFEARDKVSREVMAKSVETRELLSKAGFDASILSGGSTGTYNIDSKIRGVTELQVGSYVFMDLDYRRNGGKTSGENYSDFHHSLTVLATVVNATHADRVSVDAGTKALDTTTTYKPEAKSWPGLTYNRGGDEFGILTVEPGEKLPRIGDRLEFIVPHCDPTTNLYDRIYATRGEKVEAVWPIAARRERVAGL